MNKYHYTECGLNNIYLLNGVEITKYDDGEEEIYIHDIQGLNKKIGMLLVEKPALLNGDEIKFIRTYLDLSQKTLGNLFGVEYQSVLMWEKGNRPISVSADRLLRALFLSFHDEDKSIYQFINELAALDLQEAERIIELKEESHQWKEVA